MSARPTAGTLLPSDRPDLAELLDGMIFTIEHDKPARGQVA